MDLRVCSDLDEAGALWRRLWPAEDVFGCWDARKCFHDSYDHPVYFIVAESDGRTVGFMGLSRIDEEGYFGNFPGEIWQGRTWFEQNRIPAESDSVRKALWEAVPGATRLRYLVADLADVIPGSIVDETGYLFRPPDFGFDFEEYWRTFSGKSRKKLNREIDSFGGLEYSQNAGDPGDIEWMFETNLSNFSDRSYFSDNRFQTGFASLLALLAEKNMLRISVVSVMGRRAAVDVGAVHNNRYTVLAGATDPEFPGIAKAINLFHIKYGCDMRFDQIDFLCGDFGWKERFHLEPRPLFMSDSAASNISDDAPDERKVEGAFHA